MTTFRFLVARFLAQRLLTLATVVTLAFTIGVLVAGPIYADAAREAILASALRGAAVTVRNLRLSVYGGPGFDLAGTDAEVAAALEPLPLRSLVREGLAEVRLAAGPRVLSAPVLFRTGAALHLDLRGRAPEGPGEVALPSSTARRLRVRLGETLRALGPTGERTVLRVVGTFAPPDPRDPFWFGSGSPFPPPDSTSPSPALVAPQAFPAVAGELGLTAMYAWDAYLALDGRPYEEVRTVPARIAAAVRHLRGLPGLERLATVTGLDTLMELVRQRVENLRAPISLVVVQIAAVALAVLAGVASLALTRQAFELAVLHSRGFPRRALLSAQAVQGALAALAALPLGLAVGVGLARLASRSNGPGLPGVLFPVRLSPIAVGLAVGGCLVGAALPPLLSLPHVGPTVVEERRALSREARPLLSRIPVELVVAPLGVFAYLDVRARGAGGPVGTIDPLVLLAPTLLLFAASFLALRLLLFALRRLDGAVGRARSLPAYLAARRLGRSPGAGFAASLLLVLAVGLLVVSTSYRAVVLRSHAEAARHQVGSDWNLRVAAPEGSLAALAALPARATGVVRADPAIPGLSSPLPPEALAVDPRTFGEAAWWRPDYADRPLGAILRALSAPPPGVPVPAGEVRAALTAPRAAAGLELVATFLGPDGRVEARALGSLRPGRQTLRAGPVGGGRLLSLALRAPGIPDLPARLVLAVHRLTVGGEDVGLEGFEPLRWRGSDGGTSGGSSSTIVEIEPGAGHVVGGLVAPSPPLPAVVSPEVRAQLGDRFELGFGVQRVAVEVVAEARAFPTVTPGAPFVVLPAPAVLERAAQIPEPGLELNEVWARGPDPRPALRRAGIRVGGIRRAATIEARLAQLPESLAVGMHFTAAAGGLGLVVIGVAVALSVAQRRREFEFAALRAMGTEPGRIARAMALEQAVLVGYAALAGGGLGWAMLRLMMPILGRSLAARFPEPVLTFDVPTLAAAGIAIAASTAAGLAVAVRAVLRSSVVGVLRGEAE